MSVQQLEVVNPPVPVAAGEEPAAPNLSEVQAAVGRLPWRELSAFATWFEEFFADEWDRQIERDALAGRLDFLAAQADAAFDAGQCHPL